MAPANSGSFTIGTQSTVRAPASLASCALAQLVEQARVLDGNDGLRGEILDQLNLLGGERADLLPVDADCPNQLVLLEHWHAKHRAGTGKFDRGDAHRVAFGIGLLCSYVGNVDHLPRPHHAAQC